MFQYKCLNKIIKIEFKDESLSISVRWKNFI